MNNEKNLDILASWSLQQKEVWRCELEYWELLKSGDVKKYLSLWHPNTLLWPHWTEHPIDTSYLTAHVSRNLKPNQTIGIITPEAIQILNNYAVVYYTSNFSYVAEDKTKIERKDRFVHFWIYEKEKWLIIGGMNGKV